ncbi:hypothetical protein E2C01_022809 [Portunus trituberculatus]|uniref:Uncharacterized protein n=1 Tax=Portunus trituberculatus TaxID=210409 RepID=A0A5B7E708_PORTR|nr:hypothetical protein [Portunus trituberculatus]
MKTSLKNTVPCTRADSQDEEELRDTVRLEVKGDKEEDEEEEENGMGLRHFGVRKDTKWFLGLFQTSSQNCDVEGVTSDTSSTLTTGIERQETPPVMIPAL